MYAADYNAVMIAEGHQEGDYVAAWQHLIDSGLCWSLQGFFGRTAMRLIEEGICVEPKKDEAQSKRAT